MSSRLLVGARLAAARFAGNLRNAGSSTSRGFSLQQYFATLKNDIMHPETRPEHLGNYLYRNAVPEFSLVYRTRVQLMMAFFWYWMMFHFYFEDPHYHCPDFAKWTDEELGIPPLEDD